MEEEKKGWFADKRDKFLDFCKSHPEGVLTVLGGLFTLAGGAMKIYGYRTEYDDEVYMTDGDNVYRLPAKQMNSKKLNTLK